MLPVDDCSLYGYYATLLSAVAKALYVTIRGRGPGTRASLIRPCPQYECKSISIMWTYEIYDLREQAAIPDHVEL